jgi:hypothetical protein
MCSIEPGRSLWEGADDRLATLGNPSKDGVEKLGMWGAVEARVNIVTFLEIMLGVM